ncbi:hypothetical protein E6H20_01800 [Candidatus Bathyarchaeota archaeon]|nr:MAG: hypothetical protein E6H20_01800 [Candidatus Bathyarchaeota archaeon]
MAESSTPKKRPDPRATALVAGIFARVVAGLIVYVFAGLIGFIVAFIIGVITGSRATLLVRRTREQPP